MSNNQKTTGDLVISQYGNPKDLKRANSIEITPKYIYNVLAVFFFSTCSLILSVLSFGLIVNDSVWIYIFYSTFFIGTVGYSLLVGDFAAYFLLQASEKIYLSYIAHKKAYEYGMIAAGAIIGIIALYFLMGYDMIPTVSGGVFLLILSNGIEWIKKRNSKD